jgi:hypothetical protein
MKKIMMLLMSAVIIGTAPVAAYARGPELRTGHTGSFHSAHSFHPGHFGNHYAYRRGEWRGNRGCCGYYGDDDDDFVGPLIAGGIFGAVLGNVLNR